MGALGRLRLGVKSMESIFLSLVSTRISSFGSFSPQFRTGYRTRDDERVEDDDDEEEDQLRKGGELELQERE